MADDPTLNWDSYPCLDDVITTADVEKKGSFGTYVNHMRTAMLLRKHARGWQFELRTTTDENARETHVFRAPDGSGYVVGFFRAPTGSGFLDTPDMPQSIMNKTNQAIKWDKITARDVTDTERRAMCTCAARHFGLAWQLWAKEPLEDPYRDEAESEPAPATPKPKASGNAPTQAKSTAKPEVDALETRRANCQRELAAIYQGTDSIEADATVVGKWKKHMKHRFNGASKSKSNTSGLSI